MKSNETKITIFLTIISIIIFILLFFSTKGILLQETEINDFAFSQFGVIGTILVLIISISLVVVQILSTLYSQRIYDSFRSNSKSYLIFFSFYVIIYIIMIIFVSFDFSGINLDIANIFYLLFFILSVLVLILVIPFCYNLLKILNPRFIVDQLFNQILTNSSPDVFYYNMQSIFDIILSSISKHDISLIDHIFQCFQNNSASILKICEKFEDSYTYDKYDFLNHSLGIFGSSQQAGFSYGIYQISKFLEDMAINGLKTRNDSIVICCLINLNIMSMNIEKPVCDGLYRITQSLCKIGFISDICEKDELFSISNEYINDIIEYSVSTDNKFFMINIVYGTINAICDVFSEFYNQKSFYNYHISEPNFLLHYNKHLQNLSIILSQIIENYPNLLNRGLIEVSHIHVDKKECAKKIYQDLISRMDTENTHY